MEDGNGKTYRHSIEGGVRAPIVREGDNIVEIVADQHS